MAPAHYAKFLELSSGDEELAREMAELHVGVSVSGKIGPYPPMCCARMLSDHVVRLDCINNLPFWMEIDMEAGTAQGLYATDPANPVTGKGRFEVTHCDATRVKVKHTTTEWFDLEAVFVWPAAYS